MKVLKKILFWSIMIFSASPVAAINKDFKMPETKVSLETCLRAALTRRAGDIEKLELTVKKDGPTYEIEIRDPDTTEWEYTCHANTGEIVGEDREVNLRDPLFKAKIKVTDVEAKKAVLTTYPGKILQTEYEMKPDGRAVYEFDIRTSGEGGKELKVEVDTATGEITESSEKIYQIGREPDEMVR
jgi:uncharacterized membrane protein YkoI